MKVMELEEQVVGLTVGFIEISKAVMEAENQLCVQGLALIDLMDKFDKVVKQLQIIVADIAQRLGALEKDGD